MENCNETFLDDIVAVYPLSVGVLNHAVPETVVKDTVSVNDLGYVSLSALQALLSAKVRLSDVEDGYNTCMLSESPSVKIATDRTASGYVYTMTLIVRTLYYREDEKRIIRKMEWEGNDYIIERRDGTYALVRYFSPAQKVVHEVNDEGANVTIVMKNLTGVQRIIDVDESDG